MWPTNPTEAQRCDCGYDFTARQIRRSFLSNQQLVQIAKAEQQKEYFSSSLVLVPFFGEVLRFIGGVLRFVEVVGKLVAKAVEKLKQSRR
jgi:hypothetical protein